jgi:hypothetical protein
MARSRIIFAPRTIVSAALKLSVLAALLILVSPALRTRAAPYTDPLVNPFRRVAVEDRVNNMARLVEKEIHRTGEAPQPRDLSRILERMYPARADAAIDPWGSRYALRRRASSFHVVSVGPDRRQGTKDDIVSDALPIPNRRRQASGF